MTMKVTAILLCLLLATACAGPRAGTPPQISTSWRQAATGDDRDRLRDWRNAFADGLATAQRSGYATDIAREGALLAPDAALAGPAIPNGDYRCRVVKVGARLEGLLDFIAYPSFKCRVRQSGSLQSLAKLGGSQRYIGRIFPGDAMRQVFLGTLALGDETRALDYGVDRERNVAGHLERIGSARWRLVMPRPHFESKLDVLELVPATLDYTEMRNRLLGILAMTVPAAIDAATLRQAIASDMPQLMALYRDLHANPELSMLEHRTSAKLAQEARKLGFDVTEKVGGTGVVAVLKNGSGPVLLIRADMDALPLEEQTGLPFASKVRATARSGVESGVMHACGHDTHMAGWIGSARRLSEMKHQWSGTLVMILQPGEETGEGANAMLADGLYTRFPKPQYVLAFHDAAALPAGVIGITPGYALANVDSVDVLVRGVGGHGAYPHTTRDPIVLAARIVTTLQTLVSRENDPANPAVVTVGSFHAGTKHNIISDEARLQLTVRSYTPEVRQLLLDGIKRIARGEAIAAGIPEDRMPEVTYREKEYTPATFNTEKFAARGLELFGARFGKERVTKTPAVMGGEDFSRYRLADPDIESLIFWVGGTPRKQWDAAGGNAQKLPSLHSPFWAPEAETVISTATEALTVAALDVLRKH